MVCFVKIIGYGPDKNSENKFRLDVKFVANGIALNPVLLPENILFILPVVVVAAEEYSNLQQILQSQV